MATFDKMLALTRPVCHDYASIEQAAPVPSPLHAGWVSRRVRPMRGISAMKQDLTGRRFGRLKCLHRGGCTKTYEAKWVCRCDCGNICEVRQSSLKSGVTRSCGCLQKQKFTIERVKHGHAPDSGQSSEYHSYYSMLSRCHSPSHKSYSRYGGRGIRVCESWRNSFMKFLEDMGPKPSRKYTIERIDNNRGYEPDNCRWATISEQQRNTNRTRWITADGETLTVSEWAERLGVKRSVIHSRLGTGWSEREAVTTPRLGRGRKRPSPAKGGQQEGGE